MQIDFHHAATYVISRLAGMAQADAATVAHASQYVDDATNDGPLRFSDGQRYVRATSAHKMLDLQNNSNQADNRLVWVPFHFLPGNEPGPAGANSKDDILYRMMCKPDSEIARRMVIDCIQRKQLPFALHRLGIALHTYVDTWAHQQFVTHASKSLDIFYRVASAMNKFFSIRAFLLLLATTTIMYWISP